MACRRWLLGWTLCGTLAWGGCDRASKPPAKAMPVASCANTNHYQSTPEPTFAVTPAAVTLAAGDAGVQMLATARGGGRDLTAVSAWRVEPAGVAAVEPGGYLRPLKPGAATAVAKVVDEEVRVPVVFADDGSGTAAGRPWGFGEDVLPVLTRAGCNTGACHGRADGQNGFHLSFLGYDAEGDYRAITRDAGGRRVSRVDPAASLVLAKASGRTPHAGGPRIPADSPGYRVVADWLAAGAPERRGKAHGALTALAVEPATVRLDGPGPQQLRVVATYADGHHRDVTRLASFRTLDDSAAAVTPIGGATLLRKAEVDLVVRYGSQVVSTRLATVINPGLNIDFANRPRRGFIDDLLFARLESLNVPPSPTADDPTYLRRVRLDLTGQQPDPDETRQFLADADPEKRPKLVDRLLASREFVLFWKIKFGDLLQISQGRFGNGAAYYHTWLDEQLTRNAPWDQSVRTLLTALGNPMVRGGGAVNYALDGPDAKAMAEQTAQRFLALRLRCAQCHDHPFDVWTQDDYFGLAAFFAKVRNGGAAGPGMMARSDVGIDPKGELEHLRTKRPAVAKLLGGPTVTVKEGEDPRKALADWMTSADNPYFARATANWVWSQFFGRGIADPPDDLSRANPPVHPELLDGLARHFVSHGHDLRNLIRTVVTSEAYALSSGTVPGNEGDHRLFSHQSARPLTAHQMADALAQATDVPNRFPSRPASTRAIDVAEPGTASTILDTFGRCGRTIGCASVATPALSLRQSLLLLGGDVIESKVSSLNGYLANLLELGPEADEVVDNLYLRVLCRPATAEERSRWSAELKQSSSPREASEDLFWALLNSREFAFNH